MNKLKLIISVTVLLLGVNLIPIKITDIRPIKAAEPVVSIQTVTEPITTIIVPTIETTVPIDLKTEAKQIILGFGLDETQVICFSNLVDHFYNWSLTEQEMLLRLNNVHTMYASFCSAWKYLQHWPTYYPPPVGFN